MAVMMLSSVLIGGAGMVAASQTQSINGDTVDSIDQTNTTYVPTTGAVENFTVNMTEDQTGSTSYAFSVNVTPDSVDASTSSGSISGTSIQNGTVYVNTSSTSDVVDYVHFSFNASDNVTADGGVPDAVNYSESASTSTLVEDPDSSEVHEYRVVNPMNYLDYEVTVDNGDYNESISEYDPNSTSEDVQITFEVTRNNTTNEDIPLEKLYFEAGLHKSYFTDISETTEKNTSNGPVLKDITETRNNTTKTFAFDLVKVDNTSDTWTVTLNATVQEGSVDDAIVYGVESDSEGGVETSSSATIALSAGTGDAPLFFDVGDAGMMPFFIGGGVLLFVIGGLVYARQPSSQMAGFGLNAGLGKNIALVVLPIGVGGVMVGDYLLDSFNVITDQGVSPEMVGLVGGVLILAGLGMVVREYRSERSPR